MPDRTLYFVSPPTYVRIDTLIERLKQLLRAGHVDPSRLEESLKAMISQAQRSADEASTSSTSGQDEYRPENFLYLTAPQAVRELGIEHLALPTRTRNSLKRENLLAIGQLLACSSDDLADIRNVGPVGMTAIESALSRRGLHLAEYNPAFTPPPGDTWVRLAHGRYTLKSRLDYTHVSNIVESWSHSGDAIYYLTQSVWSVGELLRLTPEQVEQLPCWNKPGISARVALQQIQDHLDRLGLSLAETPAE